VNSSISGEYKLIPIIAIRSHGQQCVPNGGGILPVNQRKGQSSVGLLQLWQSRVEGGALLGWRENVYGRLQTSLFPANALCGGRSERERKLYAERQRVGSIEANCQRVDRALNQ